jgi:hypothetical protein
VQNGPGEVAVPPEQITVRLRNGVGRVGLARSAAGDLQKVGFNTVVIPGVANIGLATTVIEYGPGRSAAARTLATALPGARLKKVDSLGSTIQVIVGADWSGAQPVRTARPSPSGSQSGTAQQQPAEVRTASQNVLCK